MLDERESEQKFMPSSLNNPSAVKNPISDGFELGG
jgi:hypothetical protein